MRQRHRSAAELALEKREFQIVQPAATDRLREIGGIEPHLDDHVADGVAHLDRHMAELFDLVLKRVDLRLDEASHGRDDQLLFFGQSELHVIFLLRQRGRRPPGAAARRVLPPAWQGAPQQLPPAGLRRGC